MKAIVLTGAAFLFSVFAVAAPAAAAVAPEFKDTGISATSVVLIDDGGITAYVG